jgi:predicted DNA-binding transcriptional regulator AlpA
LPVDRQPVAGVRYIGFALTLRGVTAVKIQVLIPADAPAIVRHGQVARWFGVHPATIRAWVRRGFFPQPVNLGVNTKIFSTEEVRAYAVRILAAQAAGPVR